MSLLRTLKKLVLGETWILPCGIAALLIGVALVLDLAVSGLRGRALLNGWFLALAAARRWTVPGR